MNFSDLDLNLLTALEALLTERSVSQAAARLHRSQPALSASLKRLRHVFNDELLVRVGNQSELTPLAVELRRRLRPVLTEIERVFDAGVKFNPSTTDREFKVMCSDYAVAMVGPIVAEMAALQAPGVRLTFGALDEHIFEGDTEVLRAVDGIMLPLGFVSNLRHVEVHQDRWVCLIDAANTVVGKVLTVADTAALDWVCWSATPDPAIHPLRQLALLGVDPRFVVSVAGFLQIPDFIAGTNRISFIQERLARRIAGSDRYRILECPFEAVPLVEAFWWHDTLDDDAGHIWFRSLLQQAGQRMMHIS